MKLRHFLLCFLYIILAPYVFGQASTIKINEFLIEPTPQIVELLNTGTEIVDLSNWYIDDNGGTTYFTIPTGTQLYPNACLSITGNFNLNRTSDDTIRIFDQTSPPTSSSANLVDSFEYKASSGSGVTFQRIPDGQSIWSTGSANFDLSNLTGLSCKVEPTAIPSPLPTSVQATPTPTTTPNPEIKAVYLSEIYPYPDDDESEWVELFNDNAFSVFLDNWKLDDVGNGGSSPKKFSITIPGYSFKVVDLSSSIFNNDGDDVRLLNSKDELVDSFSYDDVEKGKSVGRTSFLSSNYCMQYPSKNYSNNSCINKSSSESILIITPTPDYSTFSDSLSSSVLGATVDDMYSNSWEPVRPTQFYERPTMVEEKNLDNESVDKQARKVNHPQEQSIMVVKTSALISAIASFLTAGLIFIRIII